MATQKIINVRQLGRLIQRFGEAAFEELEQDMLRRGNELEALAVELAPIDTGELESSSNVKLETEGSVMGVRVTFDAPHATAAHENPENAIGERTALKPGNKLGQAGPKFLERPLRFYQKQLAIDMGKALQDFWKRAARKSKGSR